MAHFNKTIKVENLVQTANKVFASKTSTKEERATMFAFITDVLISGNAYRGFIYLTEDETPEGHFPGIRWSDDGKHHFGMTDSTRVRFV